MKTNEQYLEWTELDDKGDDQPDFVIIVFDEGPEPPMILAYLIIGCMLVTAAVGVWLWTS